MLHSAKRWIKQLRIKFKFKNVRFGKSVNVGRNSVLEGYNVLGNRVTFDGYCGRCTYIGSESTVYGKVGRFCSVGENVTTLQGAHPTQFVSTSPCFYSTLGQTGVYFVKENAFVEKKYADRENRYPVVIGNDVWIGYGAVILGGITIGDGAIIGAGAVVTKNVEPYAIVAGNPAKVLRKRFDDNTVAHLLELAWWDKDLDWIRKRTDCFVNVEEFLKTSSTLSV